MSKAITNESSDLETLNVVREGAVVFAEIAAPPMNLLGPELIDSDLFLEGTRTNEFQQLTAAAVRNGFQTREAEMNLAQLVHDMHGKTDV
jgi:hypothetical protein